MKVEVDQACDAQAGKDVDFRRNWDYELERWILQANWSWSGGVPWDDALKLRRLDRSHCLLYDAPLVTNNPTDYASVTGIQLVPGK